MTEQEKREKAIEEIHSIISTIGGCAKNYGYNVCPRSTCSECASMIIYDNYILRREVEVRKETAKEVIKYLREKGVFSFDYPDDPIRNVTFSESIFEEIEDKFGVEVEE